MPVEASAFEADQSPTILKLGCEPSWFEKQLRALAKRPWLAILLAGLIPLIGRGVLAPVLPVPKPAIQDEFGYLLAADTFAHGRLTNPTPAFAEHFETLQQIIHPTYASKYPPFSSLLMALGEKLFGEAWIGVWLSMGILGAALCWALMGWMPPAWAMAGVLAAVLRIGLVSYWTETYWGGSSAAIGGALVIGAVPRLIRRPRVLHSLLLASGLAILANTRPYEGLLLAAICLSYLGWALARRKAGLVVVTRKIILPAALALTPVFLWMAYYNYRVTGHALEMPYVAHDHQYNVWSPWLWKNQPGPAPQYSNAVLREFWIDAYGKENQFAREHWLKAHVSDVLGLARFFLGWPIALCMLASAAPLWRNPKSRRVILLGGIFYAGCAFDARLFPHYAAPATALVYLLAAWALRTAWRQSRGSPGLRWILAGGVMAMFVVTTAAGLFTAKNRFYFSVADYHVKAKREMVANQLRREPGRQLVLVSYGSHHDPWEELVYNRADIDASGIVWARSLGPEKDNALIRYYLNRTVWLLEEDGEVKLKRYLASTESTTPTQLGRVPR